MNRSPMAAARRRLAGAPPPLGFAAIRAIALLAVLSSVSWAGLAAASPPDPNTPDPCTVRKARLLPRSGLCTHGPDLAPAGKDIHTSALPAGPTTLVSTATPCDGDGVSGKRVHVLYVRASDTPDRYAVYLPSFRLWATLADQIYGLSAVDTGGGRHIRFVQDASCAITVTPVTVSPTGDDNFDNTIAELKQQGFNRTDRKYMLFTDALVYCGIGTIWGDDQPGAANPNNTGPSYGRTDAGCWGDGFAPAHELMHNLGGVQLSAPNSSGGWHCTDEWDVMCYSDSPGFPDMRFVCPDSSLNSTRFDCNHDDYYHTDPPPTSYLATHWNAANSEFLGPGTNPPPCQDEFLEPDDTVGQARPVAVGLTELHAFCVPGDQDWVAFAATAGTGYRIETLNLAPGNDTVLELYAANGTTLLAGNDDSNGTPASVINFTAGTTTTLYARARHASSTAASKDLTYELRIGPRCPDDLLEPDNTAGQARAVAAGVTETHAFCVPGDQDWVSFPATAGTGYRLETLNLAPGNDTVLELYAADGTTLLASNDDSNGSYASLIDFTAGTAGPLSVKARSYYTSAGDSGLTYDLRITAALPLLLNPGFELDANGDGRPDGWTKNANFTRSSAVTAHAGTYEGRFSSTANAGAKTDQTVTGLSAGRVYGFSGWVNIPRQTDSTFTFKCQVRWLNASNATIKTTTVKTFKAATAGWAQATANLTAPAGTTHAQVRLVAGSLNGTIYVDDLRFQ